MRLARKTRWSPPNNEICIFVFECELVGQRDSRPDSRAVKQDGSRFGQLVSSLVGTRWSPQHAPEYVTRDGTRLHQEYWNFDQRPDNNFCPPLMYGAVLGIVDLNFSEIGSSLTPPK